jgi:hypothetical protein
MDPLECHILVQKAEIAWSVFCFQVEEALGTQSVLYQTRIFMKNGIKNSKTYKTSSGERNELSQSLNSYLRRNNDYFLLRNQYFSIVNVK